MYIEDPELSALHADIKYVDNSKYILQDCGSKNGIYASFTLGTWVRVRKLDLY